MRKTKTRAPGQLTWLPIALTTFSILLIIATLVPLISTNWWLVRIFTFPQAQITALLVMVAVAALLTLDLKKIWAKLLLGSLAAATVYQLQYLLA